MNICVFCSSSSAVDGRYVEAAKEMGALIARGGHRLVYGGGGFGLMGAMAEAAHENGGSVVGIIPRFMAQRMKSDVDELIIAEDMRTRKAKMDSLSDAFIALPGGFGTLEEILEIITLCQLNVISKPVAFVDTAGFYDSLQAVFEQLYKEKFAKPAYRGLYRFAADPREALSYVEGWTQGEKVQKWF
jgi:uncharacterized protein (TIGR00730 family)